MVHIPDKYGWKVYYIYTFLYTYITHYWNNIQAYTAFILYTHRLWSGDFQPILLSETNTKKYDASMLQGWRIFLKTVKISFYLNFKFFRRKICKFDSSFVRYLFFYHAIIFLMNHLNHLNFFLMKLRVKMNYSL